MKKTSEKLFEKLKNLGLYPIELPERTRAGRNLLAGGSWRWSCYGQYYLIGSYYTMLDCIKSNRISACYDDDAAGMVIYPEDK